eukprot:CAMPEP_0113670776 /NCGR_PEP_ID=MMETSP0038_2-20120614/5330_1 /TAXON_ID=2898 /ORGANISM="Cryptomonas paramecium" /LENGTH=261 /DNA_ID=CAMNT_0000586841 /DNA_START=39 /DNA_END=820 /DNA_ORIENTATION=+ /assembly_acc=CAM_ASM_000170
METYFLTGSADSFESAVAEYIGDYLVKAYPNICFVKDLRHPCEWSDFRRMICDSRGFDLPGNSPIVWRKSGHLIGSSDSFMVFAKEKYGVAIEINEELMRQIQQENLSNIETLSLQDTWTPLVGTFKKCWKDGVVFEGSWKDHKPKKGTITFADGSTYTGNLMDGKYHGSGFRKYADGSKFRGLFNEGKREGLGKFQDASGNEYEGYYANDLCHGKGTRKWASGRVYCGEWRANEATGVGWETVPAAGGAVERFEGGFLGG